MGGLVDPSRHFVRGKDDGRFLPDAAQWRTIHAHVKHRRISKMYKSEFKRLEISCPLELSIAQGQIPDTVDGLTTSWV